MRTGGACINGFAKDAKLPGGFKHPWKVASAIVYGRVPGTMIVARIEAIVGQIGVQATIGVAFVGQERLIRWWPNVGQQAFQIVLVKSQLGRVIKLAKHIRFGHVEFKDVAGVDKHGACCVWVGLWAVACANLCLRT